MVLASLAEPKTRTCQVVVARTKQKLAVKTAKANAAGVAAPAKMEAAPVARKFNVIMLDVRLSNNAQPSYLQLQGSVQ